MNKLCSIVALLSSLSCRQLPMIQVSVIYHLSYQYKPKFNLVFQFSPNKYALTKLQLTSVIAPNNWNTLMSHQWVFHCSSIDMGYMRWLFLVVYTVPYLLVVVTNLRILELYLP